MSGLRVFYEVALQAPSKSGSTEATHIVVCFYKCDSVGWHGISRLTCVDDVWRTPHTGRPDRQYLSSFPAQCSPPTVQSSNRTSDAFSATRRQTDTHTNCYLLTYLLRMKVRALEHCNNTDNNPAVSAWYTYMYTHSLTVIASVWQRTFLGRRFDRVDLIKPVSNVWSSVRAYVRPSTKSFFDFDEIWHVGRGRWTMHDGI